MNECVRMAITAAWSSGRAGRRCWGLSEGGERLGSRGQKFEQNPMGKEEL